MKSKCRVFFVFKLSTNRYILLLHTAKPHSSDLKTQFNRCSLSVYCSFDSAERHPCASLGLCWTGSLCPQLGYITLISNNNRKNQSLYFGELSNWLDLFTKS